MISENKILRVSVHLNRRLVRGWMLIAMRNFPVFAFCFYHFMWDTEICKFVPAVTVSTAESWCKCRLFSFSVLRSHTSGRKYLLKRQLGTQNLIAYFFCIWVAIFASKNWLRNSLMTDSVGTGTVHCLPRQLNCTKSLLVLSLQQTSLFGRVYQLQKLIFIREY